MTLADIERINNLINQSVTYSAERRGTDDWQTLAETLALGKGDCEDYALAKYHLLHVAGEQPYLMSCYYNDDTPHMVCVCQDLVLDNIDTRLLPLDSRHDLSDNTYTLHHEYYECLGVRKPVWFASKWWKWLNDSGIAPMINPNTNNGDSK